MVNRFLDIPLYRQVSAALEARVRAGELAPGDALPKEGALAQEFGVNRLTVRQALGELAQRGLIRTVHGRGSFVAEPAIRYDISGAREASLTRAMRETGRTVRQQLLRTQRDEDAEVRRRLASHARLRRYELLRFVDEVPWTLTAMWMPERRFPGLEDHWDGAGSLYDVLETHFGVRMRRQQRTIWAEAGTPQDAEHLAIPVGSPVLVMEGLNVDDEGRPVALVRHRGRGDRVQFTVRYDET